MRAQPRHVVFEGERSGPRRQRKLLGRRRISNRSVTGGACASIQDASARNVGRLGWDTCEVETLADARRERLGGSDHLGGRRPQLDPAQQLGRGVRQIRRAARAQLGRGLFGELCLLPELLWREHFAARSDGGTVVAGDVGDERQRPSAAIARRTGRGGRQ